MSRSQRRTDFNLGILPFGQHPEELHDGDCAAVLVVDDHRAVRLLAREDLDLACCERQAVAGLHQVAGGVARRRRCAVPHELQPGGDEGGVVDAVVHPLVGGISAGAGKFADQRAFCPRQGFWPETERHLDDVGAAAAGRGVGHRDQQHLERGPAGGGLKAQAARRFEGELGGLDREPSLAREPGAKQSAQGRGKGWSRHLNPRWTGRASPV
ncbi:hypothetical protein SRABI128_04611 [Microbacterium sp. Bi128]|nr:hypothetical protein SRABI128_04611 [Microbacterium sp. Bi128]